MNVASHKQRAREVSPFSAGQTNEDARATAIVCSGDICLQRANVEPTQVSPGGQVEVRLKIRETAEFTTPFDPAVCNPPELLELSGLTAEVTIDPDWTAPTETSRCIPIRNTSAVDRAMNFDFIAPELPEDVGQRTHNINVSIKQPGLPTEHHTIQLVVQDDGFDDPQNPPGGGNNGGGGDNGDGGGGGGPILPCFLDWNRSCAGPEAAAWMILIAVVLGAVVIG